jgi:MFS superfamily sulfate permease-like transporter
MSIWWEKKKIFETWNLPSSLAVVVLGLMVQSGLQYFYPDGAFTSSELVQIPAFNQSSFTFHLPEMHNWLDIKLWKAGLTIALVASLETLLNLKATDNLDPYERKSPPNHELMAQGLGNFFAGILGGIPITSVVVRSSVNIQSGARSRWSAVLHGFWLVGSMVFLFPVLNFIPLCSLSTLLILGGYKLAKASIFRKMYQRGVAKFIPFLLTILAIVFTDLLIGILLGWISHGIIGRIKLKTLERNGAVKVEAR